MRRRMLCHDRTRTDTRFSLSLLKNSMHPGAAEEKRRNVLMHAVPSPLSSQPLYPLPLPLRPPQYTLDAVIRYARVPLGLYPMYDTETHPWHPMVR